jgi:hypothetical protein
MPRINTTANDSTSPKENGDADTMPSGLQKLKRSKTKRRTTKGVAKSPGCSAASARTCHQYLASNEANAIESWNDTVPKKATRSENLPNDHDPVIKAYLEAKLSLFRNAGVTGNLYSSGNQGAKSVSSTQS